jgi:sec-independent protein translocase protein TatB
VFDIGISEFAIIGVIALVVLGPERLPKVARTVGQTIGKLQRYVAQVKSDINREMETAELSKIKAELEDAGRAIKSEVEGHAQQVEQSFRDTEQSINIDLKGAASDPLSDVPTTPAQISTPADTVASIEDDWSRVTQAQSFNDVTHTSDSHRPINEDR